MKNGMDTIIGSGVLMPALVWLIFNYAQPTSYVVAASAQEERMEALPNCVYEGGTNLYITGDCAACEEQKAVFGDGFEMIKTTFCENGACERRDITKFPTWIIKGEKYESVFSLERISALSGCRL
jgi:hypothetical protein